MHHRAKDISGLRVGYLSAIRYTGSNGRRSLWEVKCQCGRTIEMAASELLKLQNKSVKASCRCLRFVTIGQKNTKHGMSAHPAYAVWRSLLARCHNPKHPAYSRYGGRGIRVCAKWQRSFDAFWADMGLTYVHGLTIERSNNSRGYTPSNCIWVTRKAQASNTRANRWLGTPRGRMTAAQAADTFGVKRTTLLYRLDHGWPLRKALGLSST